MHPMSPAYSSGLKDGGCERWHLCWGGQALFSTFTPTCWGLWATCLVRACTCEARPPMPGPRVHTLSGAPPVGGGLTREAGPTSTTAAVSSLGDCAERPWKPRLQAAWPGRPHPMFRRVTSAGRPDQHPGRHVPGWVLRGRGLLPSWWPGDSA